MKRAQPTTRVIDARGMLVVPGFIDAHIHFLEGGFGLSSVQLRDAKTPAEFTRRIAEFAEVATVGSVDQERRLGPRALGRGTAAARMDRPGNARAPGLGAIDSTDTCRWRTARRSRRPASRATTPDVAGGTIVRDENGEPTGIFKDNAQTLVSRAAPPLPDAEQDDRALDAGDAISSPSMA